MTPGPGEYEDQSVSPSVVKAIRTAEFSKYTAERFDTEPGSRSGSRDGYSNLYEYNKMRNSHKFSHK